DNGRVVKGIRFVSLVDAGDPVQQAKRYDAEGADELTFLDITASSDKRDIVANLVRRVADEVFIPFTVGGGLRTVEDIRAVLRAGADKVTLNTAAVQNPNLISDCAETFGSQCIVVAIDARRRQLSNGAGWEVYTHGGRKNVGLDAVQWAVRAQSLGAGEILLTSMDRDGTRDGYDVELTKAITDELRSPNARRRKCSTCGIPFSLRRVFGCGSEELPWPARRECEMTSMKTHLDRLKFDDNGLIP